MSLPYMSELDPVYAISWPDYKLQGFICPRANTLPNQSFWLCVWSLDGILSLTILLFSEEIVNAHLLLWTCFH